MSIIPYWLCFSALMRSVLPVHPVLRFSSDYSAGEPGSSIADTASISVVSKMLGTASGESARTKHRETEQLSTR